MEVKRAVITVALLVFWLAASYYVADLVDTISAEHFGFFSKNTVEEMAETEDSWDYISEWTRHKFDKAAAAGENALNIGIGFLVKKTIVLLLSIFWLPSFLAVGIPLTLPAREPQASRSRLILLVVSVVLLAIFWGLFTKDLSNIWGYMTSFNFNKLTSISIMWKMYVLSALGFSFTVMLYRLLKQYAGALVDVCIWLAMLIYTITIGLLVPIDLLQIVIIFMNLLLYMSLVVEQTKALVWEGGIKVLVTHLRKRSLAPTSQ